MKQRKSLARQSERHIEKYLCQEVEKAGGTTRKFTSPGHKGVPDRICFFPGGRVHFVEVKEPDGKLSPIQIVEQDLLRKMGAVVLTLRNEREVDVYIKSVQKHWDKLNKQ